MALDRQPHRDQQRHIAAEAKPLPTWLRQPRAARWSLRGRGWRRRPHHRLHVTGDTRRLCAAYVQAKIGAMNAFAFDVSAACAGSLYGLVIADQFIRNGAVKRALVIGAETLSRMVDWTIARPAFCLATPPARSCWARVRQGARAARLELRTDAP